MRKARYEIDMTRGPLFGKLISFSVPLMLTGILQLLYNAADMVVVGKYGSDTSLAAVGSTGSLINLIVNVLMGMSVGAGVVVANAIGAGNREKASHATHTAIFISIIFGIGVGIFGVFMSRPLLEMMKSPEDVIELSSLYVKIYFAGLPVTMLYNFGSSILRATGDTKRPLYFLILSGNGERSAEPCFCNRLQDGRCRGCDSYGHFNSDIGGACNGVSYEKRRSLQALYKEASHIWKRTSRNDKDRASRRTSGFGILNIERNNSVVYKLVRIYNNGGKCGSKQP